MGTSKTTIVSCALMVQCFIHSVATVTFNSPEMDSTATNSSLTDWPIKILLPISVVLVLVLLIVIAVACIIIHRKRKARYLSNLTKPHKQSEGNSYASSEHSREFSSKKSDSPDPGYDVIKMEHLKEVALKPLQVDSSPKCILSRKDNPFNDEYLNGDPLYSTIDSTDDDPHKIASSKIHSTSTGEYHKRESSGLSTDDNCSNNSGNEIKEEIEGAELNDKTNKPHTYSVVHSKVRDRQSEQKNKVLQDTNEAPPISVQKHSYSSGDEAPSIPPHTVEMMYTAVQKRPKDSVEIEDEGDVPPIPPYPGEEDEGDAPPIPPYIGEEYHTSGT